MITAFVLTTRVKVLLWIAGVLLLIAVGIWIERGQDAKEEVKVLKKENKEINAAADKLDTVLTEKVVSEGRVRHQVQEIFTAKRESKSEDEVYREYLDTPIPERTRRLYELAGKIQYGPVTGSDGSESGDDQKDPGSKD